MPGGFMLFAAQGSEVIPLLGVGGKERNEGGGHLARVELEGGGAAFGLPMRLDVGTRLNVVKTVGLAGDADGNNRAAGEQGE